MGGYFGAEGSLWRNALRACKRHFVAAFCFSLALNLLYLAPALFMMQVYDRVLSSRGLATLVLLGLALLLALGTAAVLDWTRGRLLTRVGVSLDKTIAPELMRAVLGKRSVDEQARRTQALRDFDTLRQVVAGPGTLAAIDLPWAVIFLIILAMIHWSMAVVGVVGMAIIVALSVWNDRSVRAPISRASDAALASYASVEQSAGAHDAITGLGMRSSLIHKHAAERAVATNLQTDASLQSSGFQASIRFFRLALQSFVLGWGAFLAIRGDISPGAMIAASILMTRFIQPVEQLNTAWPNILRARSAFESLKPILDGGPTVDPMPLPAPQARLTLEKVIVNRPQGGEPVLKAVSLAIEPGQIVGVVGPSGSGKTTLARVAVGALSPSHGAVRLDGAELAQWPADALGRSFGYLPQNLQLLAGTVFDNISRFRSQTGEDRDALAEAVVEAAKAADAHALILSLPKGYDTPLGPNGAGLSGGQSQRIALARALFGAPPVLVLDEPNAYLDADGETALLKALQDARQRGQAVLMIAHRGAVMTVCDRLVVLRDGRIDLDGPREEVAARLAEAARRPAAGGLSTIAGGGRP